MAELAFVIRAVDQATQQLEAVSATMRRVSQEVDKQTAALMRHKEAVERLGIALTAAGAAISTALGAAVSATIRYANEIDRAAKTTGISAEEMQRLAFAAQQEHASLETLSRGLVFLSRHMTDAAIGNKEAERTFRALGISVKDAEGNLRPVEDVLLEVADRLRATSNESLKAELAVRLFGRSGAELIPFLQQGSAEIRRLGDIAEEMGIVLGRDAVAAGERFGDILDMLQTALAGIARQLGAAVLPVFERVAVVIVQVVAAVAKWIKEHQELARWLGIIAAAVAAFMAAAGPVLLLLPQLIKGWNLVSSGLASLVQILRVATVATAKFIVAWGPWLALAAAVVAAVGIIVRNLDNLGNAVRAVAQMFAGFGDIVLGALTFDVGRIQRGWDGIKSGFNALREALAATAQRIASDVGAAWNRLRAVFVLPELPEMPRMFDAAVRQVEAPAIRMGDLVASTRDRVGGKVKEMAQDVIDATSLISGVLVERGRAWEGFASEAVRAMGRLGQSTKETLAAAAEVIRAEMDRLQQELLADIEQFVNTMGPALIRAGQQWQGMASEAQRAAGLMGQSTRETAAAAQEVLRQWEQYTSTRIQQMQHELEMGRLTTQQWVNFLQQLLQTSQLTAQQRMQVERALVQTVVSAAEERVRAIQREQGQVQVSSEQIRAILEYLAANWGLTAEQIAAVWHQLSQRLSETNRQITDNMRNQKPLMDQILEGWQSAFEQFFFAVISGSRSMGEALTDLGRMLLHTVARAIAQALAQIVADWLKAAIASIWASTATKGGIFWFLLIPMALAAIAAITGLVKFAEGGIVKKPTLGLVGEAGPEAIIPLRRVQGLGTTIQLQVVFTGPLLGDEREATMFARRIMSVLRREQARVLVAPV